MRPIAIIKHHIWEHKDGRTASVHGALPYVGVNDGWEVKHKGYTTMNDNGTTGLGRVPFKTLDEARSKFPNLPVIE